MMSKVLSGDLEYAIHHGDVIPHLHEMPENCIDLSVYSPPFPSVFSYTDKEADLGNSEDLAGEAPLHFSFFFHGMMRVMKPGRVMMVHCTQIALLKRSGKEGMFDFRGLLIRLAQRAGFTWEYDWLVRTNPQAQAIRTKSRSLQFSGLESDRAASRGSMGMYMLKFRKPGENREKINSREQVSRNQWIDWAECCWADIKETDTLNTSEARCEEDTKHICPMQLGLYERIIRLYSNPGEVVFDPFAGIGSCGFVALGGTSPVTGRAILDSRRFYGCELKPSYYETARRNCDRAMQTRQAHQETLFTSTEAS